jgi:hypothetical protein
MVFPQKIAFRYDLPHGFEHVINEHGFKIGAGLLQLLFVLWLVLSAFFSST